MPPSALLFGKFSLDRLAHTGALSIIPRNGLGLQIRIARTPYQTSDVTGPELLIGKTIGTKRNIANHGYYKNGFRTAFRDQGRF